MARRLIRKVGLEKLVSLLVAEHRTMADGLERARQAVLADDFPTASLELSALESTFKQHIADEEAQLLRVLIGAYGVDGAREEIRVFQQHRPIHALMETVKKLAALPPEELAARESELSSLFAEHTLAEERIVFPRALDASKVKPRPTG